MDRNEALSKFTDAAVEVLAVDPSKVTLEASFSDDLGADSLDLVELVMALEETFDIEVAEDELKEISTVGQVSDLIYAKLHCASQFLPRDRYKVAESPSRDWARSVAPVWASRPCGPLFFS